MPGWSQPDTPNRSTGLDMATLAEGLAIASASTGWLARHFGTARYDEIEARVAAILEGKEEPPPALLVWARSVVECETERRV
jgi:hypothetical protein